MTTIHRPRSTHQAFTLADDRGAVAVIALFMSLFLIGTLWFLWGLGDALAEREQLQNGADAVGFAAAVYDARGMNVLAMMNLVMAAVLSILVAMRTVQLILFLIDLLSCIAGGPIDPVCDLATAAEPEMAETVDTVGDAVMTALRVLHYTEGAVAIGWPWLAEYKSILAARDYAPGVVSGFSVSGAQFMNTHGGSTFDWNPVVSAIVGNAGAAWSAGSKDKGEGASAAASDNGSKTNFKGMAKAFLSSGDGNYMGKYGLPVQNDSYKNLCSEAAEVLTSGPRMLTSTFHLSLPWFITTMLGQIEKAVGYAVGNLSFFFCQTDTSGLMSFARKVLKHHPKNKIPDATGPKPPDPQTSDLVSKKLFDGAKMFDDNFAIWSTVYGGRNVDDSARRVQVAAMKTGTLVDPLPDDANIAVAKAEFYYEAKPGDEATERKDETSGTSWKSVMTPNNCLWNMRWRARLRRYSIDDAKSPGLDVISLAKSVTKAVLGKVSPKAAKGFGMVGKFIPDPGSTPPPDTVPAGFIH